MNSSTNREPPHTPLLLLIVAAAACCAIPALVAAGVLSVIASWLRNPAVAALAAVAALIAALRIWPHLRRSRQATRRDDSTPGTR